MSAQNKKQGSKLPKMNKRFAEVDFSQEVLRRSFTLVAGETRTIDEEKRTVEIAFSSEHPVLRYWGWEVISHEGDDMDLSRLNDSGAVLVDHRIGDHIGVIERAWIDKDKRGRAVVRFGRSSRAQEKFQDVIDGILTKVSFGYAITGGDEVGERDGVPVYRVRTQPFEISFTAVPADASVGVGRSFNQQNKGPAMDDDDVVTENNAGAAPAAAGTRAAPQIDVTEVAVARSRETAAMLSLGRNFDQLDLAQEYIQGNRSLADFQNAVLAKIESRQQKPVTQLDMSKGDVQRFSLVRAVRAVANNSWKGAEFELECTRTIAERVGRDPRGFFVPMDVLNERTLSVAALGAGYTAAGGVVGTDHLAGSFIDALRAKAVVMRLGARVLDGLVGDVDIPRLAAGATFGWIAEDADAADSDPTITSLVMTPKTIAGSVPMTRRLLKQSSPAIDELIISDLTLGAAIAIDRALLQVGGGSAPIGILGEVGVSTQAHAVAGQPTFAEVVGFETAVETANALESNLAYITTPAIKRHCKTTSIDAGSGIMMWADNKLNGYTAISTTQIAANQMVFGDWSNIVVGMWGVLDIMPDTATKAASGGLVLRVFQDVGAGVRQAAAFCRRA